MKCVLLYFVVVLLLKASWTSAAGADKNFEALANYIETNRQELEKIGSTPEPAVVPVGFPCQLVQRSAVVPKSVHTLRPSDINIIASLGDSITAAFGAESRNILQLFTEYRGVSWSGGGEDDLATLTTMPNILKFFNPHLYGYAVGTGGPNSEAAVFNIAVTGAVAEDVPAQATKLVNMMRASPNVNFTDHWKLITLWIGGNDLCAVCDDPTKYSPENFQKNIETALDILREIPRVFVNLVAMMDITRLHEIREGLCDTYHKTVCPCVQRSDATRAIVTDMAVKYQAAVDNIALLSRFQTHTFAVVVQPFFKQTQVPRTEQGQPDRSYFAPDCFHFSGKSHAAAAIGLWNNMLEPTGSKELSWGLGHVPKCPTPDRPYLCTVTNNCGSSSVVEDLHPTGGKAPPPVLDVEQRTVLGCALVLLIVVPIAIFAYYRHRRLMRARADYTLIPGDNNNSSNSNNKNDIITKNQCNIQEDSDMYRDTTTIV